MEDSGAPFDQPSRVEIGAAWLRNPFGSVHPEKRVQASLRGLQVEGQKFVAHADIERAFFAPREGDRSRVVVIARGRPRIAIQVLTPDEAKRLLDALGFGPDRKHQRFRCQSLVARHLTVALSLLFLCALIGSWGEIGLPHNNVIDNFLTNFLFFSAGTLFLWWLSRASVVVGADGITIQSAAIGKGKFISYADILKIRHGVFAGPQESGLWNHVLAIDTTADSIRLDLIRGERNEDEAAGLVERIQEAHAAWRAREVPVLVESMLTRGEKSARAWIHALHEIDAADEVHYRVAPVDREALFATVEDPTKEASLRVGAAIALRRKLDDEGRARLRVSAEATAEPKLRVALEQVASGIEGEELETLVDDLDETRHAQG